MESWKDQCVWHDFQRPIWNFGHRMHCALCAVHSSCIDYCWSLKIAQHFYVKKKLVGFGVLWEGASTSGGYISQRWVAKEKKSRRRGSVWYDIMRVWYMTRERERNVKKQCPIFIRKKEKTRKKYNHIRVLYFFFFWYHNISFDGNCCVMIYLSVILKEQVYNSIYAPDPCIYEHYSSRENFVLVYFYFLILYELWDCLLYTYCRNIRTL